MEDAVSELINMLREVQVPSAEDGEEARGVRSAESERRGSGERQPWTGSAFLGFIGS